MGAGAGFLQLEGRAAGDDLPAVLDEDLQGPLERQQARLAVHQRQQLHAEGRLQRRVLEELVEDLLGLGAALELDDDAHAAAVGLVAQIGDVVQAAFTRQLGDALDERRLVDLVGQLGDDDAVARAGHLLDVGHAAHDDAPLAGAVGLDDPLAADDHASGGEVRPRDEAHQLLGRDLIQPVVLVDQEADGVGQLHAGCAAGCWWPCRRRCRWRR